MAHTDGVPPDLLNKVAGELKDVFVEHLSLTEVVDGSHLNINSEPIGEPEIKADMQVTLCETFAVWRLKPGTIEALATPGFSGEISDWSEPTKSLHHQVRQNGKLVAYARSRAGEGDEYVGLTQYNVSALVSAVDHAIDIIDQHEKDDEVAAADPVVRLLEIPSHHVSALCLFAQSLEPKSGDKNRCVLVQAPQKVYEEYRDRLLNSVEFFDLLKRTGVIRAIIPGTTDRPRSDL